MDIQISWDDFRVCVCEVRVFVCVAEGNNTKESTSKIMVMTIPRHLIGSSRFDSGCLPGNDPIGLWSGEVLHFPTFALAIEPSNHFLIALASLVTFHLLK